MVQPKVGAWVIASVELWHPLTCYVLAIGFGAMSHRVQYNKNVVQALLTFPFNLLIHTLAIIDNPYPVRSGHHQTSSLVRNSCSEWQ